MREEPKSGKWNKINGKVKLEPRISIYFKTTDGKIHADRNQDHNQFKNLNEKIFEKYELEEWKIRDWKRKKGEPLKGGFEYKGFKKFCRSRR